MAFAVYYRSTEPVMISLRSYGFPVVEHRPPAPPSEAELRESAFPSRAWERELPKV